MSTSFPLFLSSHIYHINDTLTDSNLTQSIRSRRSKVFSDLLYKNEVRSGFCITELDVTSLPNHSLSSSKIPTPCRTSFNNPIWHSVFSSFDPLPKSCTIRLLNSFLRTSTASSSFLFSTSSNATSSFCFYDEVLSPFVSTSLLG